MIRFCLVVLGLAGAVTGCATKEWVEAQNSCQSTWNRQIPPYPTQVNVGTWRRTEIEVVDLNARRRDFEIAKCTATTCDQRYGNPDCRPPGK